MPEFRLLTHAVSVRAGGELRGRLEYLTNSAGQEAPLLVACGYEAVETGTAIELREEGWRFARAETPDEALRALDERIEARVLDYLVRAGRVPLRAGLVRVGAQQVLLVGVTPDPLGPLVLQLGRAGAGIEGDAIVLVRDGEAIAYPRRLRLDRGALAAAPELEARTPELPSAVDASGTRCWALDPRLVVGDWDLAAAPVDAVVLVASGAGRAELLPEPVAVASVAVLAARLPGSPPGAAAVRETTALLRGARCFSLTAADATAAAAMLARGLDPGPG